MKILIHSQDESDADRIYLGIFVPPMDIQSDMSLRRNEGQPVQHLIDELWAEFRTDNPQPESDSQFTEWLVSAKGWTECKDELFDVTVRW